MSHASDSRSSGEAAMLLFGVGFFLPILAGGNVLFLLEPDAAVPYFLLLSIAALGIRLGLATGARPPRAQIALLFLLALAGWWSGTLLLRPAGPRATLMTEGVLAAALLYFFLTRTPTRGPEGRGLVAGIVTGAALTTIYAQYQYWVVYPELTPMVREALGHDPILSVNANFYNANCYAAFLAACLLLCAGLVRPAPGRARIPWPIVPAVALAVTLLQTESRAAIALLLAVAGGWLVLLPGQVRVRRFFSIAGIVLAALVAALVASGFVDASEMWRTGTLGRVAIWQGAWAMIQDHWALGVGLDQFGEHFVRYRVTGYYTRDPHNLLLQALAETGVVGLATLLGFLTVAFRQAARSTRRVGGGEGRLSASALAAATLLLAHAMVDIDWRAPANPILLFALLAISGQQADGEGA